VLIPVTVTDQKDRIVMGLQNDSFDILDQNNQELIRHFSSEDAPISLGIIFGTSDSMWGKIERSREAVVQSLWRSNPEDEFFLVGINDRPELLVDFTSSVDEIQDAFLKG
jgi:Ca-activated chloride channel family protein